MAAIIPYSSLDYTLFELSMPKKSKMGAMQFLNVVYMGDNKKTKVLLQTPKFKRTLFNTYLSDKIKVGFSLQDNFDFETFIKMTESSIASQLEQMVDKIGKRMDFTSKIKESSPPYANLFNVTIDDAVKIFDQDGKARTYKEFEELARPGKVDVRAIIEFGFVWIKGGSAGLGMVVKMLQYFPHEQQADPLDAFAFVDM